MFGIERRRRGRLQELERRQEQRAAAYQAMWRHNQRMEPEPPHPPPETSPPIPTPQAVMDSVINARQEIAAPRFTDALQEVMAAEHATAMRRTRERLLQSLNEWDPFAPRSWPADDYRPVIESFLRGSSVRSAGLYDYTGTGFRQLTTAMGGFHLIRWAHGSDPWLNLSRGVSLPIDMETRLRQQAVECFEKLGVPFIPVAEASINRLPHGGSIRLVHRQGLEAVFRIPVGSDHLYYLSAYDTQEDPPLYFLCRLPHAVPSVDAAREALKPNSVKAAEAEGITVKRQGDLFAIRSSLTDDDVRKAGGKIFPDPVVQEKIFLYGTTHMATRTAVMPGGMMLASIQLIHAPRGRKPDHKNCELDEGWWFIARNTVPVQGDVPRRPEFRPTRDQHRLPDLPPDATMDRRGVITWNGLVTIPGSVGPPMSTIQVVDAAGQPVRILLAEAYADGRYEVVTQDSNGERHRVPVTRNVFEGVRLGQFG